MTDKARTNWKAKYEALVAKLKKEPCPHCRFKGSYRMERYITEPDSGFYSPGYTTRTVHENVDCNFCGKTGHLFGYIQNNEKVMNRVLNFGRSFGKKK